MIGYNDTSTSLAYGFLGLLGLFYISFFYTNRKIFKFAWYNKGFFLPILPIVGTAYVSLFTRKKQNLLGTANWLKKHIGGPLNLWIGLTYHYVTLDVQEVKRILNHPKCFNKAYLYRDAQKVFGKNSLAFAPQELWRGRRRHFMKSFKPSILRGFMNTFSKYSYKLVEELKKLDGALVSLDLINSFSFNTFFVTVLSLDEHKFGKEMAEFGALRHKIENALSEKVIAPFLPYWIWIKYFPSGRRTAQYMKRTKDILDKIIQEKKLELDGCQDYVENSTEVPLLDLIFTYNRELMTDEQIYEEIVLFASAATESSAYVLYLGFTVLGMYPEVQEKIYKEVIGEIGDTEISTQNIGNLKYTEAVIFEIMRLVPVVPIIGRCTGEDVKIGGKTIPKGIDFVIDVYHIHREAKYWKDPEKFDPTRFMPENADKIVPYSYLPFSAGPRDCIGKNHAMALLKITYANVVKNFKITSKHKSIDELELCSAVTIYPLYPVDLHFILRQK